MWTALSSLVLGTVLSAAPPLAFGTGSATLPLTDLLALQAQQRTEAPTPPPVAALVVKSQLKGRRSGDALRVEGHFEVEVLAEDTWTEVRLLQLDPDTYLTALPSLDKATVGPLGGYLSLVTREPGRYAFDVGFTLRPPATGAERQVQLRFGPHLPPVPLRLEADASAFTVTEPPLGGSEGAEVYPRQGALRVAWRTAAEPRVARQAVRPPLEPSIPEARATWVSTLEGKASLRVRYALRLDREQPLELTLPEGYHLERLLLDAVPLAPGEPQDGRLRVRVAPTRVGETEATLEVVLTRDLGVFHLSGRLNLALPRVSWPVARLQARAHFPSVFNYRREGGSMEPLDESAPDEAPSDMPLPGKVLRFRQYLVAASAPTLELGYSVDISQSYFR